MKVGGEKGVFFFKFQGDNMICCSNKYIIAVSKGPNLDWSSIALVAV